MLGCVTLSYAQVAIPSSLRQGIEVGQKTIDLAVEMQGQGWEYIMPQPKSTKASWGNTDGRTTWYVGYWINKKTNDNSSVTPELKGKKYIGDGNGSPVVRRGGTPKRPTKLEWLLSKDGGIKP